VRAGEIHAGNETHPHFPKLKITLFGGRNDESMAYNDNIEGGNKLIANVGTVKMFGKERKQKMTRLHRPAMMGDQSILVEPSLDLVYGDKLGIAPTSYAFLASDFVEVDSYNNETGEV